jgi:hypothetical protein
MIQKLELPRIGKESRPKLKPRILPQTTLSLSPDLSIPQGGAIPSFGGRREKKILGQQALFGERHT